jgi:D-glycero-alpha-D-manno-heptose-7-phosphate kinase
MLAREACEIEIDTLKEPIGKQDQYAAAYGGLNFIIFHPDDTVEVEPVNMSKDKYREFENNLLFFYIGGARPTREILTNQLQNTISDKKTFSSIKRMTGLAKNLKDSLSAGNLQDVGLILDEGWSLKKDLSLKISDDKIDYYYNVARKNGADGGKLLGAGAGGFLMFYCEKTHQDKLRQSLKDLKEFKFKFDNFGTKVIYVLGREVQ